MGEHQAPRTTRGRPPAPILDRTPLDGPAIDLGARIGWVLRTARLTAGDGLPLRDMVTALADAGVVASESTLSRLEAGRSRSGALVDAYEQVLGLPPASLRAPLDILCRTWGEDPGRRPLEPSLGAVSAAVEPILDGVSTGPAWLAFADALSHPEVIALPRRLAAEAVARLASEVRRSVCPAFAPRYEALAMLRSSRYADMVLDVGLELMDAEGAPPLHDLARALGELPSVRLLDEMGRRLGSDSSPLLESVVTALDTARAVGGLPTQAWQLLVEPLATAYLASEPGGWVRGTLAYTVRTLPPAARRRAMEEIGEPLPDPFRQPANWTTTRRNAHHTEMVELATRVTDEVRLPEQPLLARLLFEAMYDPRMSRELPALHLLGALPFADVLVRHVAELQGSTPDPTTREVAVWPLMRMRTTAGAPFVRDWFGPDNRGVAAAMITANAGGPLPLERVEALLREVPHHRARALAALALAEEPVVSDLASGRHPLCAEVDGLGVSAAWLVADGGRITE